MPITHTEHLPAASATALDPRLDNVVAHKKITIEGKVLDVMLHVVHGELELCVWEEELSAQNVPGHSAHTDRTFEMHAPGLRAALALYEKLPEGEIAAWVRDGFPDDTLLC